MDLHNRPGRDLDRDISEETLMRVDITIRETEVCKETHTNSLATR